MKSSQQKTDLRNGELEKQRTESGGKNLDNAVDVVGGGGESSDGSDGVGSDGRRHSREEPAEQTHTEKEQREQIRAEKADQSREEETLIQQRRPLPQNRPHLQDYMYVYIHTYICMYINTCI